MSHVTSIDRSSDNSIGFDPSIRFPRRQLNDALKKCEQAVEDANYYHTESETFRTRFVRAIDSTRPAFELISGGVY